MKVFIDIPDYSKETGFLFEWEQDFKIKVEDVDGLVVISANKDGLISLARHLLNLSQDNFASGYDIHFDSYNSLEDGSKELIIQKI